MSLFSIRSKSSHISKQGNKLVLSPEKVTP